MRQRARIEWSRVGWMFFKRGIVCVQCRPTSEGTLVGEKAIVAAEASWSREKMGGLDFWRQEDEQAAIEMLTVHVLVRIRGWFRVESL